MTSVHFMSKTPEWETPQDFFDTLNMEFNFDLDVCANEENTKCQNYLRKPYGLVTPWAKRNWCNPPYGREIGAWIKKAAESVRGGALTVCLVPARTDTKWFHEYIYNKAEVRFIKGRLKFGGSKNSAPFPSMIVIFR